MPTLTDSSFFDNSLTTTFSAAATVDKVALVQLLWRSGSTNLGGDQAAICTALIRHLEDESSSVREHQSSFVTVTLHEIADMIDTLQSGSSRTLTELIEEKRKQVINFDADSYQRSLELCVRLWLTTNVNSWAVVVGRTSYLEQRLDWSGHDSLQDLASRAFVKKTTLPIRQGGASIDSIFTADYLVSSCGFRLVWTNYLSSHLKLDPSRRFLLVFRHKQYLQLQCNGATSGPINSDVFDEALDTLNLLFPYGDDSTEQLLIRHREQDFYELGTCGRKRLLDLERYKYWREELQTLLEVFNSPPRNWRQLALDRRNKLEWSAFWVTVMVAFLTLVSIPCAIIQAVYSVKSYQVAVAQAQLAEAGHDEI